MNNKKVLYLHGYNSTLHEDRKLVLEKYQLQIYAPQIDYENDPDALNNLLKDFNADFIIGSSAGGLVGFYMAGLKNVPALLFNPALLYRNRIPGFSDLPQRDGYLQVVLGAQDDVVPPIDSFNYLKDNPTLKSALNIHWIQNMGHPIPIDIFEYEVKSFLESIK